MPQIFNQAIDLLTRPPGDLVYHLIVLFALEAILGMAISRVRRLGWTTAWRQIVIAASALLVGRIVLMIVALLAQTGISPGVAFSTAITPPLERFVDLASLSFLAWAFVPLLRERSQLGLGLLLVNFILSIVVYAFFAVDWYGLSAAQSSLYSSTSQEIVWQIWSMALAGLAALATLLGRGESTGLAVVAFAALALGHLFQMISPLPDSAAAGWVRLAQLTAYPLFAILVYRQVASTTPTGAANEEPAAGERSELSQILDAVRQLNTGEDLTLAMQQVATTMAQIMQADLVAVGLPSDVPGSVELAAIHHPGAAPSPGAIFMLDKQPYIRRAITRRRPVIVGPNDHAPELSDLFGLLGSFVRSPLLIVPLSDEKLVLGLILLSDPKNGQSWTTAAAQRARNLADYVAAALAVARRNESLKHRVDELSQTLRQHEFDAAQRRAALESQIQQAQAEAQQVATQLTAAERRAQQQQQRAEELAALVDLQEQQATQRNVDHDDWQQQAQQLAVERKLDADRCALARAIERRAHVGRQLRQLRGSARVARMPALGSVGERKSQQRIARGHLGERRPGREDPDQRHQRQVQGELRQHAHGLLHAVPPSFTRSAARARIRGARRKASAKQSSCARPRALNAG